LPRIVVWSIATESFNAQGFTMIAAAVLAATLLQPVGDTTWWHTKGAEVMQEADQNVCALFVFERKDAVGFFWDKAGLTSIVFFNEQWNFSPSETKVAVRIGNNWISEKGGMDWFRATEKKNALMVPIRYDPVENLLSNATSVSLRRQDADFNMPLDKSKMPTLLKAVSACRGHLK
jgi:hypothetical protein